ncbi:MAG: prephenate dehydratase [Candidatus Hadarchaeales archaeon]
MRVAVLGPKGTYSDLAAREFFKGRKMEPIYFSMISDVVAAVEKGDADVGFIPVESLMEGSVGEALDALAWHDVKIQAEMVFPISHSLLAVKGARLKDITQVLSHPQALAQCREFIKKNLPKAELIEMSSTAKAAEQVAKVGQKHMAAIGPKILGKFYGLVVLREDIQSGEENITRFFCISKVDREKSGRDKTSIVFYTARDRPGILYEILGEFAERKINLTKIESRPSKKALGDYLFFIDFEGHREDQIVKEALEGVRKKTAMLKILGSYPRKF